MYGANKKEVTMANSKASSNLSKADRAKGGRKAGKMTGGRKSGS
jgi:hypothetical protein